MSPTGKSSPQALLFDLDGTLVDTARAIAAALSELAARRGGGPADVAAVRKLVSRGVAELVSETLGPLAGESGRDVSEFREILAQTPTDQAAIYPGAIEALHRFVAAGHRCAVVTNKPEGLSRKLLAELNLARFFSAIVGGDSLARCKPDPAPLLDAMARLEASPEATVMIGDSEVDAAAAAAAKVAFILFDGGYGPVGEQSRKAAGRFVDYAGLTALLAPGH